MDPCGTYPYDVPTCAEINMRLANLADDPTPGERDLAQLASDHGVPFLDLYAAFAAALRS